MLRKSNTPLTVPKGWYPVDLGGVSASRFLEMISFFEATDLTERVLCRQFDLVSELSSETRMPLKFRWKMAIDHFRVFYEDMSSDFETRDLFDTAIYGAEFAFADVDDAILVKMKFT